MKRFMLSVLAVVLAGTMLMSPAHTYRTQAFTEEEMAWIAEARAALTEVLGQKNVMALVYLADRYEVRSSANEASAVVTTVSSGQQMRILDVEMNENYEPWVLVSFSKQDQEYVGYVQRSNLACSDELFLEWEMNYGMNPGSFAMFALTGEETVQTYADIEQFPESYRSALLALKQAHPNWVFVKMDTGLDWNTVVQEELKGGRSLIPASLGGHLQEGQFSNGWSYATKEALEYYLDPRNGLTEKGIFQFEQLTFNESYHMDCEGAVQRFLDNTFMKGEIPQAGFHYAYGFWIIGKAMNISPFHLASRVYQEQGRGTSPLISGTYPGYEGYYNYFNIGASGKSDKEVIENGLSYAKNATPPWDTPYHSLHFGAQMLGANYITKGQDTLYLQKFDVDSSNNGLYWHQYMQNICAPSSEAVSIRKLYEETGALDNMFVFKIPVYQNMPETASPLPTSSDRVILDVLDGYADALIYVDGVAYPAEKRNGYYIAQGAGLNGETAVMYRYDENGIPVGMSAWKLENKGTYYKTTQISGLEDLMTYHGFSIRVTGRAGIRYKTGVSTQVRDTLLQEGIDGYKLKEYGTLVMTDANRKNYPMVVGGEKVAVGKAYGLDGNGNLVDNIYETVNGRYRFTSVLVGLPAQQYKTDFAFRGYMVLAKGEEEVTLYGPIMSRSIYRLAQQALDLKLYPDGSAAKQFLEKLIADGDNPPLPTVSSGDAA